MREINFVLLSDGSSDQVLIPIIEWVLQQQFPDTPIQAEWADLARLPRPPKSLGERIVKTVELYGSSNFLFVHRDAENQSPATRDDEIQKTWDQLAGTLAGLRLVKVIPVRMTEAWLMTNQSAIKKAAGNPNFSGSLGLPAVQDLEQLPDPKEKLYELIETAAGQRKLNVAQAARQVADYTEDFSPLKNLPSFLHFEEQVQRVKQTLTNELLGG